jgi:DNA-binding SARP family transcriptional activator
MIGECTSRVQLNLLGAVQTAVDGRPIVFRTKKALALLAYLALDPGPHPRERLADLLWPEADVVDARASLRTALNYLRRALGCHANRVLIATRDTLGLDPASLELDLAALMDARRIFRQSPANGRRDQLEVTVELYRGPFLAGLFVPDAPDFESWIEAQRAYWRGVEAELLDRLASLQFESGESGSALVTLELWTAIDPDEELAWQRLIETHLHIDDRAGARRAWTAARRAQKELNATPSNEMNRLRPHVFRTAWGGAVPDAMRERVFAASGNLL